MKPKKLDTVLVQVVPSNSPAAELEQENDSDPEQDGAAPSSQLGRDLSDMMIEEAPSDHTYLSAAGPMLQAAWMKRVEREWRILSRGLPETIHIHLYEDRMDLMRAAIVGPKNTPYADALLFFDLHISQDYPRVPPSMLFWAHGKRLNPNLYASGKICLSLLGTWSGTDMENWQPQKSNILQVLVSILGLVLVEDPYFNEPGFEITKGKAEADSLSRKYSEDTRLQVLRSMLLAPPKGFEEFSKKHFERFGHSIVKRAERLATGAAHSCIGRIDGIDFNNDAPSEEFKKELTIFLPRLKEAFPKTDSSLDEGDTPDPPAVVSTPDPPAVALHGKASKLAWVGRLGRKSSTIGGG